MNVNVRFQLKYVTRNLYLLFTVEFIVEIDSKNDKI